MSARALAMLWALLCVPACALVHERGGDVSPGDVSVSLDAGVVLPVDATPPPIDAGPITSCESFWQGLPSCPASPALAVGQPCALEGAECGTQCCEPGPPIACRGGRWSPVDHMANCMGVRCRGPRACGAGMCAFGRVCVVPPGPLGGPAPEQCVVPPAPIDRCAGAPPGSIGMDPMACTVCSCGSTPTGDVQITIDCRCC